MNLAGLSVRQIMGNPCDLFSYLCFLRYILLSSELILWDSVDSRCLESCLSPNIHNAITAHVRNVGLAHDRA